MDYANQIRGFLDEEGRIKQIPAKRKAIVWCLFYLAQYFEKGRQYTEREVNDILNDHMAFRDPATFRREMYDYGFFDRTLSGSAYWLADPQPTEEILPK